MEEICDTCFLPHTTTIRIRTHKTEEEIGKTRALVSLPSFISLVGGGGGSGCCNKPRWLKRKESFVPLLCVCVCVCVCVCELGRQTPSGKGRGEIVAVVYCRSSSSFFFRRRWTAIIKKKKKIAAAAIFGERACRKKSHNGKESIWTVSFSLDNPTVISAQQSPTFFPLPLLFVIR